MRRSAESDDKLVPFRGRKLKPPALPGDTYLLAGIRDGGMPYNGLAQQTETSVELL